jgi:hypothetical protein
MRSPPLFSDRNLRCSPGPLLAASGECSARTSKLRRRGIGAPVGSPEQTVVGSISTGGPTQPPQVRTHLPRPGVVTPASSSFGAPVVPQAPWRCARNSGRSGFPYRFSVMADNLTAAPATGPSTEFGRSSPRPGPGASPFIGQELPRPYSLLDITALSRVDRGRAPVALVGDVYVAQGPMASGHGTSAMRSTVAP